MLVNKPEVEENKDQEAVLKVLASPNKKVVLGCKPCKKEEVVVEIPQKVVKFFLYVLLSLLFILFEHYLPLFLCNLKLVVSYFPTLIQDRIILILAGIPLLVCESMKFCV